jgi:hypothetical protein
VSTYVMRDFPPDLRARLVAVARREGRGLRAVILEACEAMASTVEQNDEHARRLAAVVAERSGA